jgi:hypothetical protein
LKSSESYLWERPAVGCSERLCDKSLRKSAGGRRSGSDEGKKDFSFVRG